MFNIYMDSGTSNTRIYLTSGYSLVDLHIMNVGTKDSAIGGTNEILLSAIKEGADLLLHRNTLSYDNIENIWLSGMVTNAFGIVEVEHLSVPLSCSGLFEGIHPYQETQYFNRPLRLIRGVKTASPGEAIDFDNLAHLNNARGEEIEVFGLMEKGALPFDRKCLVISPGSHTHTCYVNEGQILDIMSNFTGELNHAIKKETILAGELDNADIPMDPQHVRYSYDILREYGFTRALYIIHASKVFHVGDNNIRSQLLTGIIAGSVVESLLTRLDREWGNVDRVVILGGKNYVDAYGILMKYVLPDVEVMTWDATDEESLALQGFYALLRIEQAAQG